MDLKFNGELDGDMDLKLDGDLLNEEIRINGADSIIG